MGEREKQYKGSISYKKLFQLMSEKEIKKRDLREIYNISPTIISRLNNNSNVAVDTIMYLCEILHCQPGDIIEYIPDNKEA
ncbi:MAG: helix-turn-helix transcriptional regulator [Blautia sp.]|uniref:helix-turn-helix domain-containing protein n=1 Tax=Blautia sp. TaxID=1955243 RepID=UPI002A75D8B6|nr:helix-turn-helix transcriptional regulator [Blautia sp.]MDY3015903.1 helix-turn-helix transcriptional regulator [Blautia sp.]